MRSIVVGGAGTIGKAAVNALVAVLHCVEDDDRGNPSAGWPARSRPGACRDCYTARPTRGRIETAARPSRDVYRGVRAYPSLQSRHRAVLRRVRARGARPGRAHHGAPLASRTPMTRWW